MINQIKYTPKLLVVLLVLLAVAFSLKIGFAQDSTQISNGKKLMIDGAKMVNEGKESVARIMTSAKAKNSTGIKMISDGYTLVKRADNLWTPTGDNDWDAKGMMLQGAKMMLDGKKALLAEIKAQGLSEQAAPGQAMLNNGEVVMLQAKAEMQAQ